MGSHSSKPKKSLNIFSDKLTRSNVEETKETPEFMDKIIPLGQKQVVNEDKERKRLFNKAKSYLHQGNVAFRDSRYDIARNKYSIALSVLKAGCENHSTQIASVLNNLAIMEFAEGRYEEAKNLLREALELRRELSGREFMEDGNLFNIGLESAVLKLKSKGIHDSADAEKFVTKIIEHKEYDGLIADSINNIAAALVVEGNFVEAKNLFQESLEIRKASYD